MIDLYISETCPYSIKVMEFLRNKNIDFNKLSVSERENMEKLMEIGGKMQVPFMHDRDKNVKMYESDDIIEYFSKG